MDRAVPKTDAMEETKPSGDDKKPDLLADADPIVTQHEIVLDGRTLRYRATTGRLPIKNDKGETEAQIFFIAYTKDGADATTRPLLFAFNGGPGSASVWLHLGALGPKRATHTATGDLPAPPYGVEDNPFTWLDQADIVFVDPVGTGYSRAKDDETAKKFWSVDGDIASLTELIRLYLTRYDRWRSPLYLAGESYGTTRGAGLAGALIEKGIALSGLLLVSSVLNFQTIVFGPGNDLPYALFLPSYTAAAWYHRALSPALQRRALPRLLREVEAFAAGEYALALMQGDRLSAAHRTRIAQSLARYTGLSEEYVRLSDLRIHQWRFSKELLRRKGITIGRLDSRLTGREGSGVAESPEFDPSMAAIRPPYTAAMGDYVRRTLGYVTDQPYEILGGLYQKWDWGKQNGYTDTAHHLAAALAKNPHLRVFVASGYYDLATPYFATEYTLSHLGIDPALKGNISVAYYDAGHMMYIESGSLEKLKRDVAAFIGAGD